MIHYTKGNILESSAKVLVNPVNTVGVMGKGLALQFKKEYPFNFSEYKEVCKEKKLNIGGYLAVKEKNKIILNIPTKEDWRNPSKYEYVEAGLKAISKFLKERPFGDNDPEAKIDSIAIPPLGCGNGGLEWEKVKQLIESYLGNINLNILVYVPN